MVVAVPGRCCTVRLNDPDSLMMSRTVCVYAPDRLRCAEQGPAPGYLPAPAPAPGVGGSDGNFQSFSSMRSLFSHHFPTRIFIIFIGLSRVADDDLLAFALIGRAGPNQDFFPIQV